MFYVTAADYVIGIGPVPATASLLQQHAKLCDDLDDGQGSRLIVTLKHTSSPWPILVISFSPDPGPESGFDPGLVLVPETQLLLVGAGETLAAYDILEPKRLWLDTTPLGFWEWERHDGFLLMSAELEFAAWDLRGNKIWSTFVEPPWEYEVQDGVVRLDVMGHESRFELASGPAQTKPIALLDRSK